MFKIFKIGNEGYDIICFEKERDDVVLFYNISKFTIDFAIRKMMCAIVIVCYINKIVFNGGNGGIFSKIEGYIYLVIHLCLGEIFMFAYILIYI